MRFDWYAATIEASPEDVLTVLSTMLGGDAVRTNGFHGYEMGYEIRSKYGIVARALVGGKNGNPHAWASGENTEEFVYAVRGHWPADHRVTRLDSAEDFQEPGAWDKLSRAALSVADDLNLKVMHAGDFHRGKDGRTLYIGSRKSDSFVRVYEKGKQVLRDDPDLAGSVSPDWVRVELQLRPLKGARRRAAGASPLDAWGYTSTGRAVAERVLGQVPPFLAMTGDRKTEDERAFRWLCKQYGKVVARIAEREGGWDRL